MRDFLVFWHLVHRMSGLLIAAFLTVAGAARIILAWKAPLERFFAPELFVLPSGSRHRELNLQPRRAKACQAGNERLDRSFALEVLHSRACRAASAPALCCLHPAMTGLPAVLG